ncbi:AAA family ATPase [Brevibacillus nitrificans]|uniref:AAA family ATPase n=1 Tax=Brevibacillus nitrificans TaxID=651560 RepID=UPI002866F472|nr:AAA family ATPase [Brevibacillus nitrificans]MDR7317283.1 DNA repair exonuclease SbcCD ATPase subunit [Brevibacillus nitrificans]
MTNNKFLISKVHISNFRGYREKSFDLFSDKESKDLKNGIILISGPNGFGKTTLLDAIEWCLTGTVRRLENEFLIRRETSKSLQSGLIKNSSSTRGDIVTVKVEAYFNGKNIELIRTFSESTERLGFNPSGTDFKFIIGDKEYGGSTIDDLFSVELNREVQVSKYLYDRHICTFDKNLKLYNNSREDFYKSFSLFFGGTEEIESILNNLEGFEEKQGRTKTVTTGLVEELNNKIISERKFLESLSQTLKQEKDNYGELKKNIAESSNLDLELKRNWGKLIFSGEKSADHYYFSEDDIAQNYTLCKGQRERFEHLQKVLLAQSVKKYIVPEMDRCIANEDLSNFRKSIIEPFEANQNLIELIQNKDLKQYKEKKLSLDSEIYKVEQSKQFNSESQIFFVQIQMKYELEQRLIDLLSELNRKLSQKEQYNSQIKEFETNEQTTKALRALVDHISGFEQIRHSGQEKCPLCGSIEFFGEQGTELATEAKRLLGTVDNARSTLVNALTAIEVDIIKHYTEFKNAVLTVLTNLRTDVAAVINSFSELELFSLELNKYGLTYNELTIEKIHEVENKLLLRIEEQLPIESNEFSANEINSVYKFFPNKTKETYWEMYDQLNNSQKVEIFKDFIELCRLYTEDFLKTNQLLVPISDISMDVVASKLDTLRKVENELKNDELLKEAEKKVKELEAKYQTLNNELIVREKKLNKLKKLQRELKEIRNKWDKRVVEQINEPMQRIFKRLSRHTNIESLNLFSEGITTQKTNVTVTVDGGKEMYVPNVLSAGQLSMVSLSMFLTVAMGQKKNPFRCYFLDDPIQSMDDLNVLSFVDLLRVEQNEKDQFFDQLFITTCNEDLEKLIAHKMKTFNVNLCHLHFDGYGECRNI